ncbi:LytTR family DNA-binding domain-containing protein [Pedobacter sp. ASV1-7]|uniref:LytR/AlgR family response regulator transcription factor n=1 Tax=Pedobacter sp. ASV1-7 TaxID=3145237 RepID=UPI0032E8ABD7
MSCYIVDARPAILELLSGYVEMTPGLVLLAGEGNPVKAMKALLSKQVQADITFTDVDLPGLNGIEFAGAVNQLTNLVFITEKREYGPEAFEHNVMDYILTPLSYCRFLKSIEKLKTAVLGGKKRGADLQTPFLFIPGDGKGSWIKLMHEDILYVKADSNYMHFVTSDRTRMSYTTMEQTEKDLPSELFVRIHKSYIVNIQRVTKIDSHTVYLSNGAELPIGRSNKSLLMQRVLRKH